jgi:hypothetical protein
MSISVSASLFQSTAYPVVHPMITPLGIVDQKLMNEGWLVTHIEQSHLIASDSPSILFSSCHHHCRRPPPAHHPASTLNHSSRRPTAYPARLSPTAQRRPHRLATWLGGAHHLQAPCFVRSRSSPFLHLRRSVPTSLACHPPHHRLCH